MSRIARLSITEVPALLVRIYLSKKYPQASVFTIVLSENGTLSYRTLQDFFSFLSSIRFLPLLPLLHMFSFLFLHHIDVFYNGPVKLHLKALSAVPPICKLGLFLV